MQTKHTLMHREHKVLDFEISSDTYDIYLVHKVYNKNRLPILVNRYSIDAGTKFDKFLPVALNTWVNGRLIPASRTTKEKLENSLGLSVRKLVFSTNALSLSDQYWIKPVDSIVVYADINYFTNVFSEDIGDILFGSIIESPNMGSPDTTTDGVIKKKWKIDGDTRTLIKGGSSRVNEPINERIATLVARHLGITHTPYELESLGDSIYSTCVSFLQADGSNTREYVTAHAIRTYFGDDSEGTFAYENLIKMYSNLGIKDARHKLEEMIVLDYIIGNTDRHYNNFGLIRDAETLDFVDVVPIFDSGTSMYWKCFEDSDTDLIRFRPFHINGRDNLDMVNNFERYNRIKVSPLIQEIKELMVKYNLQHDVGVYAVNERLLEIKNRK